MSESNQADFASLITQAERAVEKMTDPRLKEIAFGRILDHLLSSSSIAPSPKTTRVPAKLPTTSTKSSPKDAKSDGPLTWLRELVDEGFFAKPKSSKDIQDELDKRSHRLKATDLTLPLQTLCREKKLRRDRIAPEGKGKKFLHWFNW